jgi:hypothetical protein
MCEEVWSEHTILLLPTEVLWLLRGKLPAEGFELHDLKMFLCKMGPILLQPFTSPNLMDFFGTPHRHC